jgi:hypothetical protein
MQDRHAEREISHKERKQTNRQKDSQTDDTTDRTDRLRRQEGSSEIMTQGPDIEANCRFVGIKNIFGLF